MDELTEKQMEVLDILVEEMLAHGYPPSVREIAQTLGLQGTNGAQGHLAAVEKKGYLESRKCHARARVLTEKGRQLYRRCESQDGMVYLRRMAYAEMMTVEEAKQLANELVFCCERDSERDE